MYSLLFDSHNFLVNSKDTSILAIFSKTFNNCLKLNKIYRGKIIVFDSDICILFDDLKKNFVFF